MDTVDKATRSRFMAAVKSRGNRSTEARLVKLLRRHGLKGWRRHCRVDGTPDFCWAAAKVALFVDGCFWHGCPRCYAVPKSNARFWTAKVVGNRRRDRRVSARLRRKGWAVIRVWECSLKEDRTVARIRRALLGRGIGIPTKVKRPRPRVARGSS
jgi:DNA mismatch endonuclease (patch repair protein)